MKDLRVELRMKDEDGCNAVTTYYTFWTVPYWPFPSSSLSSSSSILILKLLPLLKSTPSAWIIALPAKFNLPEGSLMDKSWIRLAKVVWIFFFSRQYNLHISWEVGKRSVSWFRLQPKLSKIQSRSHAGSNVSTRGSVHIWSQSRSIWTWYTRKWGSGLTWTTNGRKYRPVDGRSSRSKGKLRRRNWVRCWWTLSKLRWVLLPFVQRQCFYWLVEIHCEWLKNRRVSQARPKSPNTAISFFLWEQRHSRFTIFQIPIFSFPFFLEPQNNGRCEGFSVIPTNWYTCEMYNQQQHSGSLCNRNPFFIRFFFSAK